MKSYAAEPVRRPRIVCHMLTSVDGRLLVDRWTPPASGIDADRLRRHYDEAAATFGADGWIVGRTNDGAVRPRLDTAARAHRGGGGSRSPYNARRQSRWSRRCRGHGPAWQVALRAGPRGWRSRHRGVRPAVEAAHGRTIE
jgi:hypothetical protein